MKFIPGHHSPYKYESVNLNSMTGKYFNIIRMFYLKLHSIRLRRQCLGSILV